MTPIEFVTNQVWAIRAGVLEGLVALAERNPEAAARIFSDFPSTPELVAAKEGMPMPGLKYATIKNGVAEIPVKGVLSRYASMFSDVCGGTSYQRLATDISACAADPNVKAILLNVDSPGGTASGMSETSEMIRRAAEKKPVVGYVGGQACSAGYGLLSACSEVVAHRSATLGSIGAMLQVDAKTRPGEYTFVSAQSPMKNASPATEEGAAALQGYVNELAQTFIDTVAANRGYTSEYVAENFGRGGLMLGEKAVDCGLADSVDDYESTLARLCRGNGSTRKPVSVSPDSPSGVSMPKPNLFARMFSRWFATDPEAAEAALAEEATGNEAVDGATLLARFQAATLNAAPVVPAPTDTDVAVLVAKQVDAQMATVFAEQASDFLKPLMASGKVLPADLAVATHRFIDAAQLDRTAPLAVVASDGTKTAVSRLSFVKDTYEAKPKVALTQQVIPGDASSVAGSLNGLKVLGTASSTEEEAEAVRKKRYVAGMMASPEGQKCLKEESASDPVLLAALKATREGRAVLNS